MADVKFTIQYEINTDAPIPTPRAVVTMKVKADEAGLIPANVRCMDRILLEPMSSTWGDKRGDPAFRIKKTGIESGSWPAIQGRVEEIILGALARMQEADARYQKMAAEQPADYTYETTVPGPANLVQTSHNAESLYKVDGTVEEADDDDEGDYNQKWAMQAFGLSTLPCAEASDFLIENIANIASLNKRENGTAWGDLSVTERFDAGIRWLRDFGRLEVGADTVVNWISWAQNHRA